MTAEDRDDWIDVSRAIMRLYRAKRLSSADFRIVRLRAHDWTLAEIGKVTPKGSHTKSRRRRPAGISVERTHQRYWRALRLIRGALTDLGSVAGREWLAERDADPVRRAETAAAVALAQECRAEQLRHPIPPPWEWPKPPWCGLFYFDRLRGGFYCESRALDLVAHGAGL